MSNNRVSMGGSKCDNKTPALDCCVAVPGAPTDIRVQSSRPACAVTPHSNQTRDSASQPSKCTGMASSSSFEKIMPCTAAEFGTSEPGDEPPVTPAIACAQCTMLPSSHSLRCCRLQHRSEGSTIQYSSRSNIA